MSMEVASLGRNLGGDESYGWINSYGRGFGTLEIRVQDAAIV